MWSCGGGCGGSDFCVECGGDEAVDPFVKSGGVFFVWNVVVMGPSSPL